MLPWKAGNGAVQFTQARAREWCVSLVFGVCAFPPVSLGPAGDCPGPCKPGTVTKRLVLLLLFITVLVMYVYYYRTYEKAVSGGGRGGKRRTCAKGPYQPRPVRSSLATSHSVTAIEHPKRLQAPVCQTNI